MVNEHLVQDRDVWQIICFNFPQLSNRLLLGSTCKFFRKMIFDTLISFSFRSFSFVKAPRISLEKTCEQGEKVANILSLLQERCPNLSIFEFFWKPFSTLSSSRKLSGSLDINSLKLKLWQKLDRLISTRTFTFLFIDCVVFQLPSFVNAKIDYLKLRIEGNYGSPIQSIPTTPTTLPEGIKTLHLIFLTTFYGFESDFRFLKNLKTLIVSNPNTFIQDIIKKDSIEELFISDCSGSTLNFEKLLSENLKNLKILSIPFTFKTFPESLKKIYITKGYLNAISLPPLLEELNLTRFSANDLEYSMNFLKSEQAQNIPRIVFNEKIFEYLKKIDFIKPNFYFEKLKIQRGQLCFLTKEGERLVKDKFPVFILEKFVDREFFKLSEISKKEIPSYFWRFIWRENLVEKDIKDKSKVKINQTIWETNIKKWKYYQHCIEEISCDSSFQPNEEARQFFVEAKLIIKD